MSRGDRDVAGVAVATVGPSPDVSHGGAARAYAAARSASNTQPAYASDGAIFTRFCRRERLSQSR